MAWFKFGRRAASLFIAGVVALGLSGCVLVPVPAPVVAAPPVIVPPRPVFVPRPVYGYYGPSYGRGYAPYYGRGYGWVR